MSLKIRFRFDGRCTRHYRYDPTRDGRPSDGKGEGCESLYVIYLYTKSRKEELETEILSRSELPRNVSNTKPTISSRALKLGMNHEFFANNSTFSLRPRRCDAGRTRFARADQ